MDPFSSEPLHTVARCPQCGRVLPEATSHCQACAAAELNPRSADRALNIARCLLYTFVILVIGVSFAIGGGRLLLASLPGSHPGLGQYPGAPASMGLAGFLIALLPLGVVAGCVHQLYWVWRRYHWWQS